MNNLSMSSDVEAPLVSGWVVVVLLGLVGLVGVVHRETPLPATMDSISPGAGLSLILLLVGFMVGLLMPRPGTVQA